MRCPHCAGEIPDGSRFCGICGRAIEYDEVGGLVLPGNEEPGPPAAFGGGAAGRSMSLFDLPPRSGGRVGRVIAVVALDLVLAGAGAAMIVSYLNARARAHAEPGHGAADAPAAEIEILDPQPVAPQGRPAPPSGRPVQPPKPVPHAPSAPPPHGTAPPTPVVADGGAGLVLPPLERPAGLAVDAGPAADAAEADVSTGSGQAAGPLDDASMEALTQKIAAVVRNNEPQLQRCYRQVAKASGQVQGKIVIRFKLQPEGQASGVGVDSNETGSERLGQCVAASFESLALPGHSAAEPIEYRWPVVFKAP
ncbi:MAG TPA: AgmX/PglI C-terminal domain-containing protein [Kofleriaceae bacterium]|nr:AgmX/PglI C-terminal domain-containing protein [Kofleriaceae bacterium]